MTLIQYAAKVSNEPKVPNAAGCIDVRFIFGLYLARRRLIVTGVIPKKDAINE